MKFENEQIVFSTGKKIYVPYEIIGLDEPATGEKFSQIPIGSDDVIEVRELTKEEKLELADYMIALWQRFKDESSEAH